MADYGTNSKGFKLQGKTSVQGLQVAVENRKGSVREGKNEDGSKWRTKYKVPYGYIEGTKGADGDEVDAYIGPDKEAPKAYVVAQKKDDGSYDEDTVMLGFKSKAKARKAILQHYDDPKYIGATKSVPVGKLKKELKVKEAAGVGVHAYITGPSGSGKSTYAHKNFPHEEFNLVHLDQHSRFNKRDKNRPLVTDWKAVTKELASNGKPAVLEGTALRPSLLRAAERRILVDPGLKKTVDQRTKRQVTRFPNTAKKEARKDATVLYKDLYQRQMQPRLSKYQFEKVGGGKTVPVNQMKKELKVKTTGLRPKTAAAEPGGFYKGQPMSAHTVKFKMEYQGIPINVDRPKGFIMKGKDAKGNDWARRYHYNYGFIPKTLGGDGDGLDVFVGPDKKAKYAYWAMQRTDEGTFDEYKVFLGFPDRDAAVAVYRQHIPKKYFHGIVTMKVEMMKAMLGKVNPDEKMKRASALGFIDELGWIRRTAA